ncbi:MAG: histidine triad nucleotide-binding protein [Elusimicrobia bacterium]|jgi:histidine triad (HIT) family protein|nr:histidine triad nucleotide-binding protein [Elusimicrobiota bacterium]
MMNPKSKDCVFCRILDGSIETDIIYRESGIAVFRDANPQAPVHLLIVPEEHIATINDASGVIVAECMEAAKKIAKDLNIAENGYRTVINCNKDGGQEVDHLHVHLLGGRKMGWPPG